MYIENLFILPNKILQYKSILKIRVCMTSSSRCLIKKENLWWDVLAINLFIITMPKCSSLPTDYPC